MIAIDDTVLGEAVRLAATLRTPTRVVETLLSGAPGKRLKKAHKAGAHLVLILGPDEVAAGTVTVKDMDVGTQLQMPEDALAAWLNTHNL